MKRSLPVLMVTGALISLSFTGLASAGSGGGGQKTSTMYDAVTVPLHGNMPSYGFEAYSMTQIGDAITFAPGTNRTLRSVTVTLSSWGCENGFWLNGDCSTTPGAAFPLEMTFNVYDTTVARSTLATATQTFAIPYRPSASPKCGDGRWYDSSQKKCFNGLATNVTFTFSGATTLPDSVLYGIVYNTSHHGPDPVGTSAPCYTEPGGCGYDGLNVLMNDTVTVGSETAPGEVWMSSTFPGFYCDGGSGGVGVFRQGGVADPDCVSGEIPAVQFKGTK